MLLNDGTVKAGILPDDSYISVPKPSASNIASNLSIQNETSALRSSNRLGDTVNRLEISPKPLYRSFSSLLYG